MKKWLLDPYLAYFVANARAYREKTYKSRRNPSNTQVLEGFRPDVSLTP